MTHVARITIGSVIRGIPLPIPRAGIPEGIAGAAILLISKSRSGKSKSTSPVRGSPVLA